MKVQILQEFEGYPDGDDKGPTTFKVSADAVDVPDAFGTMIVGKGLARAAGSVRAAAVGAAHDGDAWVDTIPGMGTLRLKVRGSDNVDWRRIQSKMVAAVPQNKRINGIDPDEIDRITGVCLQSACLLDWDGVEDADGKPLAYSKEQAAELLTNPAFREFRDAVLWAANVVGKQAAAGLEADAKN